MVQKIVNKMLEKKKEVWTRFMDMHSGGGLKTKYSYIYIQAPEEEAISIFKKRFHRDPYDVACSCCGENFSVMEQKGDLTQATAFERNCKYDDKKKRYLEKKGEWSEGYQTLDKFKKRKDICIIYAKDIK
jgi:hypothetical protein